MRTGNSTGRPTSPSGSAPPERHRSRRRGGPPLPMPALAYAALTMAGAVTHPGVRLSDNAPAVLDTLQQHHVLATVSATLLVASAAPLAVWTAAVSHRLRSIGPHVAAPAIALVGGVVAAGSLLFSGLLAWGSAESASLGDAALVRAMSTLSFGFGGVGFALGTSLLLAGVAVPSLILRLVPRWLTIFGLTIAVAGAVSIISLLVPALDVLLPVTRFGGLVFLLAISVALPISRRPARS